MPSDSKPVIVYTTAPVDYDWGWTRVLCDNYAVSDRGKVIRKVEVADTYHAHMQEGRYGSGMYFVGDEQRLKKEMDAGFVELTANPVYYHYDTLNVKGCHARLTYEEVETLFERLQSLQDEPGLTITTHPNNFTYTFRLKGDKSHLETILRELRQLAKEA